MGMTEDNRGWFLIFNEMLLVFPKKCLLLRLKSDTVAMLRQFSAQYMCIAELLCALLLSRQTHTLHKTGSNAAARALSVKSALYFQAKSVAQWSQAQICN